MTPDRWKRAQEVFVAATEQGPDSRIAFLDEECRGDPELRKEVESLLSSFDAAPAGFLESPAIDAVSTPPRKQRAEARPVEKGTRLGPYEILSPLGAGGMGEVYRAKDERLGREVAIKVLSAELSLDASRVKRFEREARSASALNHPNIVTVYDIGFSNGLSYIAMEKIDGETLRKQLSGGAISIKRLLPIATQIADGLARAHEAGIVHRDLKPENLMVTKDGLVKILDFGLAKLTSAESGSGEPTESGTTPGVIFGTVGYMSPEQASGGSVDYRSDQFSFGSILYEMAMGKPAFQKKTPVETMAAILNEQPESLAATYLKIPAPIRWIVERCLAKDPEERYASTKDLARELASVRVHLSEASGPRFMSEERPRTPLVLRRKAILAAAVIVLAVAGAFLIRRSRSAEGPRIKRVVVLPFENLGAPEDDYFADGIADAVRGKLTSLPSVQVIARGSSTPYKKTIKTPKQIAQELEVGYLLTATVRWQKGTGVASRVEVSPELVEVPGSGAPTSMWQQSFDAALTDVFQVQSDIATRVAQALGVALSAGGEKRLLENPTQSLPAYDAFLKGEDLWNKVGHDQGITRKALGFYEQAVALDPAFAQAWAMVSRASSYLYGGAPTPELGSRAREAAEMAASLAPDRPEGYVALGAYQRSVIRDFHRALEEYAKGRRVAPAKADLVRGMALAEQSLGQWDAALDHFMQAERLDPLSVDHLESLGNALVWLRRHSEARGIFDRGLALSPDNLNVIVDKAMTFLCQGDLARARGSLKVVPRTVEPTALVVQVGSGLSWVLDGPQRELLLRLTQRSFDDDKGAWAICLAEASFLKGDVERARFYSEEARSALEEQLREEPGDGERHAVLGLALAYLGRKQEAIHEGERAVAILPVSKDAVDGPALVHVLARIYILVDEPEKALDQLELLLTIPYYLSPAWLKIDPNFDALRKNPRFQKLVTGTT